MEQHEKKISRLFEKEICQIVLSAKKTVENPGDTEGTWKIVNDILKGERKILKLIKF